MTSELPAVWPCEASGHIQGSLDTYTLWFPWTAAVAAARTAHLDVFLASGANPPLIVRVRSIRPVVGVATAVTGIGLHWEIVRTTAIGTGGTAITPRRTDLGMAAVPAQLTARQKPAGGATAGELLSGFGLSGEETQSSHQITQTLNLLSEPMTVREGAGLRIDQVTNSNVGNFGWLLTFTVEN